MLVIDLFPPGTRDPQGIHQLIWEEIDPEPFELPLDKPLTMAAYSAGALMKAFVEPVAVGDTLPDMALFFTDVLHVPTPLEATYQTTWNVFPAELKELLESDSIASNPLTDWREGNMMFVVGNSPFGETCFVHEEIPMTPTKVMTVAALFLSACQFVVAQDPAKKQPPKITPIEVNGIRIAVRYERAIVNAKAVQRIVVDATDGKGSLKWKTPLFSPDLQGDIVKSLTIDAVKGLEIATERQITVVINPENGQIISMSRSSPIRKPPEVFTAELNGVRFSIVYKNDGAAHANGRKGLQTAVEAKDIKSGKALYMAYFGHRVDSDKKADDLDYIYKLEVDGRNRLLVTTERQKTYTLDPGTGKLIDPATGKLIEPAAKQDSPKRDLSVVEFKSYRISVTYKRTKEGLLGVVIAKDVTKGNVIWKYENVVFLVDSPKKANDQELIITLDIDAMDRLVVTNGRTTYLLNPSTGKFIDKK